MYIGESIMPWLKNLRDFTYKWKNGNQSSVFNLNNQSSAFNLNILFIPPNVNPIFMKLFILYRSIAVH